DMERIKALRRRVGCTINDVVVAVVAGAVRRFLLGRDVDVEGLDFRIMVPVSEHHTGADMAEGNRVSIMIVRLPVDEGDPAERMRRAVVAMREAKESKQSDALALVEELGDWTTAPLVAEAGRRIMHLRPFNMVVTNVPGPPMPLYMVGAPLLEAYPLVPLFVNTGVGLALLSYAGHLGIGVNTDPDSVPGASGMVEALEKAFEELDRAIAFTDEAPSAGGERSTETRTRQPG
ncbi:MAG: WS/DGAT domain-containing protein, partial [Myxococcota bacterium]